MLVRFIPGLGRMLYQSSVQEFLDYNAVNSQKTVAFYKGRLSDFLGFAGNSWPPTPKLIRDYLRHSQQRGLSTGSVHANYRAVRAFLNWMQQNERLKNNPIEFVKAPPRAQPKPVAPSHQDVNKLMSFMDNEVERVLSKNNMVREYVTIRDMALFSLMINTGMRVGEIEHAEPDDIRFEDGIVRVSDKGKDRRERFISVAADNRLWGDLRLWLKVRSSLLDIYQSKSSALFVGRRKMKYIWPLGRKGMYDRLKSYFPRCGAKEIRPHQLRHYYAKCFMQKGGDIYHLKIMMGHQSVTTTEMYLHFKWFAPDE